MPSRAPEESYRRVDVFSSRPRPLGTLVPSVSARRARRYEIVVKSPALRYTVTAAASVQGYAGQTEAGAAGARGLRVRRGARGDRIGLLGAAYQYTCHRTLDRRLLVLPPART